MRRVVSLAVTALLVSAPVAGRAEPDEADKGDPSNVELATSVFEVGVSKMEKGRCEETPIGGAALCLEARDAFREAYAKYPAGLGALRNLAFVEKGLGLVALASRHFRELAEKAPLDPKPARKAWAEFARSELALLAPRVPHVTIVMPKPTPEGASVRLDDETVEATQWSVPIAVDPGDHVVKVEAPGAPTFSRTVHCEEADARAIDVTLAPVQKPLPTKASADAEVGTTRLPQVMLIGAGAVTFVVGLGFGTAAIYKRVDACSGASCDLGEWERGRAFARASTVLTIGGGLVAASGVVWYLLTPPTTKTTLVPYAALDGAGLGLLRRF